MTGKFIVFEGIDGSGTSTQALALHEYLVSRSQRALLTAEPSPGPIGNMIREIHTKRIVIADDRAVREELLSYLFAADRCDHLYNTVNGVIKYLAEGYHIISTRYVLSSLAYHVFSDEDYAAVYRLNQHFPLPDYTFFLDCPVAGALKRIALGRVPDINEEQRNLERVAKNYQRALAGYPGAFSILDAAGESNDLKGQILAMLREKGILPGL